MTCVLFVGGCPSGCPDDEEGQEKTIPALIEDLDDPDPAVRAAACAALGEGGYAEDYLGKHEEKAVEGIERLLANDELSVRWAAAIARLQIGTDPMPVSEIQQALTDGFEGNVSGLERGLAAQAELWDPHRYHEDPGQQRIVMRLVAGFLSHEAPEVRAQAARALGALGEGETLGEGTVTELLGALKDSSSKVRAEAAIALARSTWVNDLAEHGELFVPILLDLVEQASGLDSKTRYVSAHGFGIHAPPLRAALELDKSLFKVTLSAEFISETHMLERLWAVAADSTMPSRVLPSRVRSSAISALGGLGEHAALVIPKLKNALLNWPEYRLDAASALERIGRDAAPALGEVLTSSEDEDLLEDAAMSLWSMGKEAMTAKPALIAAFKAHEDKAELRMVILGCLANLALDAPAELVPLFEEALTNSTDDPERHESVLTMLARLGPQGEAIVVRTATAKGKSIRLRLPAIELLSQVEPEAAVPALLELLLSDDPQVATAASEALSSLARRQFKPFEASVPTWDGHEEAEQAFFRMLDHESPTVRESGAHGLGFMHSLKRHGEAIRRLLEMAQEDPDPEVRAASLTAPVGRSSRRRSARAARPSASSRWACPAR